MEKISQTASNPESNALTTEKVESLKNRVEQGALRINASQILAENQNNIVDHTLNSLAYLDSESIQQVVLNKEPRISLRSEIFLRCICDTSVRYINYALILENKKILEKVQPDLKFLKDRYFSLGGTNNLLVAAFSQMQSFITPLINNLDIVAELDSYFEYVIFSLVNQGHDAILKKQHQGLAKLRQEWLAEDTEDPDEQEETWSYLRDALNNGTLSHRPIPA